MAKLSTDISVARFPCALYNASLGAIPFGDSAFAGIDGFRTSRDEYNAAYMVQTDENAYNYTDASPPLSRQTAIDMLRVLVLIAPRGSDSQKKALLFYQAALEVLTVPNDLWTFDAVHLEELATELLNAYEWQESYGSRVPAVTGNEAFESKASYNYREKRLNGMQTTGPRQSTAGRVCSLGGPGGSSTQAAYFNDTNNQVWIDHIGFLHWRPYHKKNDLGFYPDAAMAFVRDSFPVTDTSDAYACYLLHQGVVWADVHAWLMHQYSFSPLEQAVDPTMAVARAHVEAWRGFDVAGLIVQKDVDYQDENIETSLDFVNDRRVTNSVTGVPMTGNMDTTPCE